MTPSWNALRRYLATLARPAPARDGRVLCSLETMFGPTRIVETQDADGLPIRVLEVGGAWESASYEGAGYAELVFPYHRLYNRLFEMRPMATRFLMLGAGGFSYPKYLLAHTHDTTIDAVEVDPQVVGLAREWLWLDRARQEFDPQGERLAIHVRDAAAFLKESDAAWDVALDDAFRADAPVEALSSPEGVALVHAHLAPGGLYVLNVVSALEGRRARPLRAAASALKGSFAHAYVIACSPDEPRIADNNVVIACDDACAFTGALELDASGRPPAAPPAPAAS